MHKRWRIVVGSSWYIMREFGGWCGAVGCKRAARRANRPKDGFGGRRPTAPAKPGRPEGRMPGACRGWWRRTGKEKLPGIPDRSEMNEKPGLFYFVLDLMKSTYSITVSRSDSSSLLIVRISRSRFISSELFCSIS